LLAALLRTKQVTWCSRKNAHILTHRNFAIFSHRVMHATKCSEINW